MNVEAFNEWYDSLPYGEPSYQETFDAGYAAAQHKAEFPELPEFPHHPEPRTMKWSALETAAIKAYGQQCAAHAMQSQAERIKELEKQHLERLLRIEAGVDVLVAERDTLRAQLAEIEKTEPSSYLVEGWHKGELWAKHHNFTLEEAKNSASVFTQHYTTVHTIPLFTRPMPAESKDAERYRWFADIAVNGYFDKAEKAFACFESAESCTKQELDAAIDAAIAKGAKL